MNSNLEALVSELVDCIRIDIEAQRGTLEILARQRGAIAEGRLDRVADATTEMVQHLRHIQGRDRERADLVALLAAQLGLAPERISVATLARHAGERAEELLDLRQELRDTSARVIRENRRLSALVGMRRRIVSDVLESILQDAGDGTRRADDGVLLNAEA